MRTLVVALIVAVLVGAISTEVYFRLLDGSHLGLLVLIVMACVTSALASPRIAARSAASGASPRREGLPDAGHDDQEPADSKRSDGSRETGTVKWFNRTKGFGFIVRENGEEIFVHHRSIRSDGQQRTSLRDGERVSFEVVKRSKGWQAEDVAAG